MDKFLLHKGVAAPMLRINIDTDAIIPSREMKRVSKLGLGEGLFAGWRYTLPGGREPNPDFVLNMAPFVGCSVLLSGANFGCGSSREHAVWALKEFGIKVIIASSFGSIFYNNCIRNGLLPIVLPDEQIQRLAEQVLRDPQNQRITVDLEKKTVSDESDRRYTFDIQPAQQNMLLEGLDAIDLTLKKAPEIDQFQQRFREKRPWLFG